MRRLLIVLTLALFAAACGISSDTANDGSRAGAPEQTGVTTSEQIDVGPVTTAAATGEATTSSVPEQSTIDGPPAPDFDLALSNGSIFTLAAAQKPVYMVFWAEW